MELESRSLNSQLHVKDEGEERIQDNSNIVDLVDKVNGQFFAEK